MGAVTLASVIATLGFTPENPANKGAANGYAGLNSSGQVPTAQLPSAVTGGWTPQGTWNAATNTPAITSSIGSNGYMYVVGVAGTTSINGISQWNVGDQLIYNGNLGVWEKLDGIPSEVVSVAGRTGAVVLTKADVSGAVGKYAVNVGDGTTTTFTITHNLGTNDVLAQVYTLASTFDMVFPDIQFTTTNTITLIFAIAPTVNQYRVVVMG
jgi:hypothetical protein